MMKEISVRTLPKLLRMLGFLTVNLLLRWPIWLSLGVLRFVRTFDYLFLVYPGTDRDLDGYCPRWLAKSFIFSAKPTIGGFITKGNAGRGLVLVIPDTAFQLMREKRLCEKLVRRLRFIAALIGAKAVAIAGQGPAMIERHGIELSEPFVKGNKGTVFSITETIREAMKRHELKPGHFKIALVGVGFVGEILLDTLRAEGHDITGIDVTVRRRDVLLPKESYALLNEADMVVVLTPRGSDFVPYIPHLKRGSVVIDDTHPRIEEKPSGVRFYKVAVGMEGVEFIPRLPGYRRNWVPGCAVEAMYSASTGDFNGTVQKQFNQATKDLGFYAHV